MGLNDIDDSREGIAKYLQRNPSTSFVTLEEKTVVGVILAGYDGRRGYIHHTAVDPHYRRQGIRKAVLVAFAGNEEGNRFWQKQGFIPREDLVYRNKLLKQ